MTQLEFVTHLQNLPRLRGESINFYATNPVTLGMDVVARKNLLRYLYQMSKINPKVLLVGEAPGKDGCAITGIPFTSEYQLLNEPFFIGNGYSIFYEHNPQKERTATAVWNILSTKANLPLMWNIYPFHPFDPKTGKNRCPNSEEVEYGKEILDMLLSMFNIKQIYGVGRKAANALADHPKFVDYIRHPSYGGVNNFKKSIDLIL